MNAYTSSSHSLSDIPCKALSIGLDGSVASARLVDRSELGFTSSQVPRMPKDTIQPTRFCGQCAPSRLYSWLYHSFESIANNPGSQISNQRLICTATLLFHELWTFRYLNPGHVRVAGLEAVLLRLDECHELCHYHLRKYLTSLLLAE